MELADYEPYISNNIQDIYNRIQQLYKLEIEINLDEETQVPDLKVEPCDTDLQNYKFYLWVIRVLRKLQDVLNELIDFYNASGFKDDDDSYNDTGYIHLYIPLTGINYTDDYIEKIKSDFKLANDIIDQLLKYAKEYQD